MSPYLHLDKKRRAGGQGERKEMGMKGEESEKKKKIPFFLEGEELL